MPARLDSAQARLIAIGWFGPRPMPLAEARRVTSVQLFSLVDEIGLIFTDAQSRQMYIRETDPEFAWACRRLKIDTLLGSDWYARTEAGERLNADLN